MKCFKCGSEMPDGAKFCGQCGAKMTEQENKQRAQYEGEQKKNSGADIGFKIVAIVFAVIYGISALRSLGALISYVRGIFYGMTVTTVLYMISSVLTCLSCVLFCFLLILIAFRRKPGNVDSLCLGVGLAAVLRILVGLVAMIVTLVPTLGMYYIPVQIYLIQFLKTLLVAAVAGVVIFVLLTYMGELKILGKEQGAISRLLSGLGDAIADACTSSPQPKATKTSDTGRKAATYAYGQGNSDHDNLKPAFALKTNRSIVAYILLSIITCGFYGYYFQYSIARDVNEACEGDGEKTGGLVAYILLCFITCGFYGLYWEYKLGNRLAQNGPRYGLQFQENGTSVLVWHLLGGLLCSLGIWVAMHILIKNTNRICQAYNEAHGL